MWTVTNDGSVIDEGGKVLFFSTERFINDICSGDCCFICGAAPHEREFNNEHIFPEWLLRRYNLFAKTITLPNEWSIRYDRYTVQCCRDCNSLMGDVIEKPISEVMQGGVTAINEFVSKGNLLKIFAWMGLIYLKTHLKDSTLRRHQDTRKGDERIADMYEWENLHHIHCLVRCFYTGSTVETEAIGSFLGISVKAQTSSAQFDYGDFYQAQTMLLRLDDIAMLSVFNDSGCAKSCFWERLKKITGPVSELQLREIMVELACLNLHLKERPTFFTECDTLNETCRIVGRRPKLHLMETDRRIRGALLHKAVQSVLSNIKIVGHTEQEMLKAITAGNFSFLFNDAGEFIE